MTDKWLTNDKEKSPYIQKKFVQIIAFYWLFCIIKIFFIIFTKSCQFLIHFTVVKIRILQF